MNVKDMPWDDAEFVAAAEKIFRAGYNSGQDDCFAYDSAYECGKTGQGQKWQDFVKHAKAGYED